MHSKKSLKTLVAPAFAAVVAAVILGGLQLALPAHAALSILPDCAKVQKTVIVNGSASIPPPGLDCVEQTFVAIADIVFAVAGSVALLFFVIGGFTILTSAGNDKRVSQGKEYLKNAIIGLVIIFTSAYIIDYGVALLRGGSGTCSDGHAPSYYTDAKGANAACCGQTVPGTNGETKCVTDCSSYGKTVDTTTTFTCTDASARKSTEGCSSNLCAKRGQICCPEEGIRQ